MVLTTSDQQTVEKVETANVPFKQQLSFEKRKAEATRVREQNPNRIPVIVERASKNSNIAMIDKKKYLVPSELTIGQFQHLLRKRIKLQSEQALFLFVANKTLAPVAHQMSHLYKEFKDEDGFLYLNYAGESTFG